MKAYYEGITGFKGNKTNPYPTDSYKYKEWERGYNNAYFQNLEKVIAKEKSRAGS